MGRVAGEATIWVRSAAWPGAEWRVHDSFAEIESLWRQFEQHAHCTAFQTFDWLAKWQHHIGGLSGTQPVIVCGQNADGRPLFLLPLAIVRNGTIRRLHWLGSGQCDYNGPLLADDFADPLTAERFALLWKEIAGVLRRDRRTRFDLVDLEKMPEQIGGLKNPFMGLPVRLHPSGAYLCNLGSNWERFYAERRSASTRQRDRNKLKRLAQYGEIRLTDIQDRGDAERTLDILCQQKARWFARMGVRNIFAQPGFRAFLLDIAATPETRHLVHLSRYDVGTCTAAVSFSLEFKGRYYFVLLSHDDGELSKFGPGRAHLHRLLQRAIERGLSVYDFTIGDEPYKAEWADVELRLYDHVSAMTIPGWAAARATIFLRRAKRFIKKTPWAWSAFSKTRAWFGKKSDASQAAS